MLQGLQKRQVGAVKKINNVKNSKTASFSKAEVGNGGWVDSPHYSN